MCPPPPPPSPPPLTAAHRERPVVDSSPSAPLGNCLVQGGSCVPSIRVDLVCHERKGCPRGGRPNGGFSPPTPSPSSWSLRSLVRCQCTEHPPRAAPRGSCGGGNSEDVGEKWPKCPEGRERTRTLTNEGAGLSRVAASAGSLCLDHSPCLSFSPGEMLSHSSGNPPSRH